MAAYCVLRGIDYIVEECPMAAGNRHLGYKEALNAIEVTSPGSKAAFYFGFLDRMAALVQPAAEEERAGPAPVPGLRVADRQRGLRLLQAGGKAGGRPRTTAVSRPFEAGERILLFDTKGRRYLVQLAEGGEFHTHSGPVSHDELIGREEGLAGPLDPGRPLHRRAADPGRGGAEDAPRRPGHLPQGPRARS